jgi:predicted transcriptional regulator
MVGALSRRERQIMDVVYREGTATAAQVAAGLPDALTDSTVRTLLRILEEKGHLRHTEDGRRYIYHPTQPHQNAARAALDRVLHTFFGGSVSEAVASLLSGEEAAVSDDEMDRLARLIDNAREGGN